MNNSKAFKWIEMLLKIPFYPPKKILHYLFFCVGLIGIPVAFLNVGMSAGIDFLDSIALAVWSKRQVDDSFYFFNNCFFWPLFESLFVAGAVNFFSIELKNKVQICLASALFFAAHAGMVGSLWFLNAGWAFYVFSAIYLRLRKKSFLLAYFSVVLAHMIQNITVVFVTLACYV